MDLTRGLTPAFLCSLEGRKIMPQQHAPGETMKEEDVSAEVEQLMEQENLAHFRTTVAERRRRAALREEVYAEGLRRLNRGYAVAQ
jgi:hypothetical protein